jgi:serine/threonine-protein kinase PknG
VFGSRGTHVSGSSRSGSRRQTRATRTTGSRRTAIGAGLVDVPPAPRVDPGTVVLKDPTVAENKRFCSNCGAAVGRSRDATPGRTSGFCPACRHPFDFVPKLRRGEIVGRQYEVMGCLAHGGLGWIYLARDKAVNDRWVVLKGLLDSGDQAAMAVAVAERRFLAELDHPAIVVIYNFVTDRGAGYIVMEYIGGKSLKQMLAVRRAANGGDADPLPVDQAIAFVLAIVPAFTYLHGRGLLYCDFKPDNLIQVGDEVRLIDLGAVRRFDDHTSNVYGTVGFQAPEIADMSPSVSSDVYTIGRTLAVLTLDFRGYQSKFQHAIPDPADHPVLARSDSFHRLLLKATAVHPDDRFQTVAELGEQMLGVLREHVALTTGRPQAVPSSVFGPTPDVSAGAEDGSGAVVLPPLAIDASDPAAAFLANVGAGSPEGVVRDIDTAVALSQVPVTVEVRLRRAQALIDLDDHASARAELERVEEDDPWEWRAVWLRGVSALVQGQFGPAAAAFDRCRSEVPGELAPKLAAAAAAEGAGDLPAAAALYQVVVAVDPGYVTAARGLARCRAATGDVAGALAAYDRIPTTHRAHAAAQVEAVHTLVAAGHFVDASGRLAALPVDSRRQAELEATLFESALAALSAGALVPSRGDRLGGRELDERGLRLGAEEALRRLARLTPDDDQRTALVDRANRIRPLTVL